MHLITRSNFQTANHIIMTKLRSHLVCFSHSVESILTAKSFARNIPGLVHVLSDQEKSKFLLEIFEYVNIIGFHEGLYIYLSHSIPW